MSKQCLYNIFASQFTRFTRIIMDRSNFQEEVALLLHKLWAQDYKLGQLFSRLNRMLKGKPHLYAGVGCRELFSGIQHSFYGVH